MAARIEVSHNSRRRIISHPSCLFRFDYLSLSAQFNFGRFIMLYWLGVYTLVAIVALVPFFLLYVLWFLVWLSLTAIRFMIRSVNNGLAIRTNSF